MTDCYYTRLTAIVSTPRLDKFLAQVLPQHSRALLQTLIANGGVLVDGCPCVRNAQKIDGGSEVALNQDMLSTLMPSNEHCEAENLPLAIIYEDEFLMVINKPPGLVTHPGHGNLYGTLQAGILNHHAQAAALTRGGIVHRLDKETSGIMVVAKTAATQKKLIEQFKNRKVGKEYLALVHGTPPATAVIDNLIRRHRRDPLRMCVAHDGKPAQTHFFCQQQWNGFALLRCRLLTGRTHQIRVHLEHKGFPLVADKIYNRRATPLPFRVNRHMLHSFDLSLQHPQTKTVHHWNCPLPEDMQTAIDTLEQMSAA